MSKSKVVKLVVAGSRSFNDYQKMSLILDNFRRRCVAEGKILHIAGGGARGADSCAELYAKRNGIPFMSFPADWDRYGRSAGFRRNEEMARFGTELFVFWDGSSRGTRHMIVSMKKRSKRVTIFHFTPEIESY
jgi:hypothetical protein